MRFLKTIIFTVVCCCLLTSCVITQQYTDQFNTLRAQWNTDETKSADNYNIVPDPTNPENSVLAIHLYPQDTGIRNGKRSELKLPTKDRMGSVIHYSFDFLLPPGFFQQKPQKTWIIIQQWHAQPPPGKTWANYHRQTHPPLNLFIAIRPNPQPYKIVYAYGLWDNEQEHVQDFVYDQALKPNTWYTFENTVKWGMDSTAYSIPKINGHNLVKTNKSGKVFGANMFNRSPNYFKIGFYGGKKKDIHKPITLYIDNFTYELNPKQSDKGKKD